MTLWTALCERLFKKLPIVCWPKCVPKKVSQFASISVADAPSVDDQDGDRRGERDYVGLKAHVGFASLTSS